jgi:hypothetical protein
MACIAATAKSLLIALDCRAMDPLSSSVMGQCNVELMNFDCVRSGEMPSADRIFGACHMTNAQNKPDAPALPVAHFPKQAVVVIHGMGEQMPMDTIKRFVRAAWQTTTGLATKDLPNPTEVWSKPDVRTGSLELRRITTRQTVPTTTFDKGVRTDFYELYWADLSGGSTWDQVKAWIRGLLLRDPFSRVPNDVFLAWIVLWLIALTAIVFSVAAVLPQKATVFGWHLWDCAPLLWLSGWQGWQLSLVVAAMALVVTNFIVPYFGRVARYTRATPENIAARRKIRRRGLALLEQLHAKEYARIVVVGHSLGSILAYDLVSYFWARKPHARVVEEGTTEFDALRDIEKALADPCWEQARADSSPPPQSALDAYHKAQTRFGHLLRTRPAPGVKHSTDSRWLITDLITAGSPLGYAEFLMAESRDDLVRRQEDREYPTVPPLRELLDPTYLADAKRAGFPIDAKKPKLLAFPFGQGKWQLHHASPFAAVRWTNIHDPALLIAFGDLISSPVAPVFGHGAIDINLKQLRGQSWRFTHTKYWRFSEKIDEVPVHIEQLRKALDLGGTERAV